MTLLLGHAYTFAAAGLLLALCAAIGDGILHRLRVPTEPGTALPLACALGIGTLGAALFIASAALGVRPLVLAAVPLLAAIAVRSRLRNTSRLFAQCVSESFRATPAWFRAVMATAAAVLLACALLPPRDWDTLWYHLSLPQQFLEAGRIHVPDDNPQVGATGVMHALYLPLLAMGVPSAPALINAACIFLASLSVLHAGRRHFDEGTATLAAALFWGSPIFLVVGPSARVEGAIVLTIFQCHALLLTATAATVPRSVVATAGLLAGIAFGIKASGLVYAAPLGLLLLAATFSWKRRTEMAALFGGATLIAALPWMVRNAVLLDAPLFPLFAEITAPAWIVAAYGPRDMTDLVSNGMTTLIWSAQQPFDPVSFFLNPAVLTVEGEGALSHGNPVLLALPLALLLLRSRVVLALIVPVAISLAVLVLLLPAVSLRYLMPAWPALTLAAVAGLLAATERIRARRVASALVATVVVVTLARPAAASLDLVGQPHRLGHLTGRVPLESFLAADLDTRALVPFARAIEKLDPASRTLLIGENRGYYFRTDVIEDPLFLNWLLLEKELPRDPCLHRAGFTHVALSNGIVSYLNSRRLDTAHVRIGAFREFAERCLRFRFERGGFDVWELPPHPRR